MFVRFGEYRKLREGMQESGALCAAKIKLAFRHASPKITPARRAASTSRSFRAARLRLHTPFGAFARHVPRHRRKNKEKPRGKFRPNLDCCCKQHDLHNGRAHCGRSVDCGCAYHPLGLRKFILDRSLCPLRRDADACSGRCSVSGRADVACSPQQPRDVR